MTRNQKIGCFFVGTVLGIMLVMTAVGVWVMAFRLYAHLLTS